MARQAERADAERIKTNADTAKGTKVFLLLFLQKKKILLSASMPRLYLLVRTWNMASAS
jgi:hypothetical protein